MALSVTVSSLPAHLRILAKLQSKTQLRISASSRGEQGHGLPGKVHSKVRISITSVFVKAFTLEVDCDQGNMGSVHGLEGHVGWRTVPRSFIYEVLDGIEDFFEDSGLGQFSFEHGWPT